MSIADARAALFGALAADPDGTPVDDLADYVVRVFDVEPRPGIAPKPSAVTVFFDAMTALDYSFAVRVYQSLDTDPAQAQRDLDGAVEAVTAAIDAVDQFGRSDWSAGYVETLDCLVASTTVEIGREDF